MIASVSPLANLLQMGSVEGPHADGSAAAASPDGTSSPGTTAKGGGDPLSTFIALLEKIGGGDPAQRAAGSNPVAKADKTETPQTGAKIKAKGADDDALALLASLPPNVRDAVAAAIGKQDKGASSDKTGLDKPSASKDADDINATPNPSTMDVAGLLALVTKLTEQTPTPLPAPPTVRTASAPVTAATGQTPYAAKADAEAPVRQDETSQAVEPLTKDEVAQIFAKLGQLMSSDGKPSGSTDDAKPTAQASSPAATQISRLTGALPQQSAQMPPSPSAVSAITSAAVGHFTSMAGNDVREKSRRGDTDSSTVSASAFGLPTTDFASALNTGDPTASAQPTLAQQPVAEMVEKHQLDLAKDTQWLDSLAKDITQAAGATSHLQFQLNPEHLGSLKIELSNDGNGTSIRMTASTETARQILVDAQPKLIAEARAQGLHVSDTQVDLGGGSGGGQRQPMPEAVIIRTGGGGTASQEAEATPTTAASNERYA